jgi:hypothetical protein
MGALLIDCQVAVIGPCRLLFVDAGPMTGADGRCGTVVLLATGANAR